MRKLLWPLLVVNLNIKGLTGRRTAYFVQNNTTIILPGDTRQATSELPCRTPNSTFGAKIEAWKYKMVHIFHFLQTGMVFETVNPFT